MNDIWLRNRGLDVLGKGEVLEKELEKTDGLCNRRVNEGKKASKPRVNMTLGRLQREYVRVLMGLDVF